MPNKEMNSGDRQKKQVYDVGGRCRRRQNKHVSTPLRYRQRALEVEKELGQVWSG
jgi:hypothetical protein